MLRIVIILCAVSALLGVSQGASLKNYFYPVNEMGQVATLYPYYCKGVCMINCPNGNVIKKDGCPACKCKNRPDDK